MVESHKERNVYSHEVAVKIQEYKISAIDVHGRYSNKSKDVRVLLKIIFLKLVP